MGSTNYYSMAVSGNVRIKKGQYASVWIFASGDNSYYVESESGFSCHRLQTNIGFRADILKTYSMATGWRELAGPWRVSGEPGLYSSPAFKQDSKTKKVTGFNVKNGRYYVEKKGVYYCSVNVRLDAANVKGNFRLNLRHGGQHDSNNGLHVLTGNYFSTNYGSLQLAGTLKITSFVSVWVYSSSDNSWRVDHESGFGCHMMKESAGFHADQNTDKTYGRYWSDIQYWRSTGNDELYSNPAIKTNGKWIVPKNGYYVCAAVVRIENMHYNSYSRLVISVQGDTNTHQGLNTITGNRGSTNSRVMSVAGTVRLEKGFTVGVKIYSSSDNSWQLRSESGFSCHLLGRAPKAGITNFEERINNGMAVIEGDGGATNYRSMGVSGVIKMKRNDHVSVFLYSNTDNSWTIDTQSGFSCHKLSSTVGFHADKDGDSSLGTNWQELQKWRVSGYPSLYSAGGGFDAVKGRYKVPTTGPYYCYAQVRIDDKNRNIARLILARNLDKDVNNGFHAIGGNWGSTNYRSMRLVGNAWFNKDDSVSLFTYSSSDSYVAHSESGFGCHRLGTGIGFHAEMSKDQGMGNGWRRVTYWRANGNEFLYNTGGFSADGVFNVPEDGYYICSSVMRIDSADRNRYFRLLLTINDNRDVNNGLHAINGYGSNDYRPLTVAGTVWLKEKDRLSVWMYSGGDNSWRAQSESGFGCHLISTYNKC